MSWLQNISASDHLARGIGQGLADPNDRYQLIDTKYTWDSRDGVDSSVIDTPNVTTQEENAPPPKKESKDERDAGDTLFNSAQAFMEGPGGFYLYAGLTAFKTFSKIKARREAAKAEIDTLRRQGDRAVEVAQRQATNLKEEFGRRTETGVQERRGTQTISGGIEEGTSTASLLRINQTRAKKAAQDIISRGEDIKRQYDQRIKDVESAKKAGVTSDIIGGVTDVAVGGFS